MRTEVESLRQQLAAQKNQWELAYEIGMNRAEEIKQLKQQLQERAASSQAREKVLRDALAHYATDETPDGWTAIAALAMPFDSTALDSTIPAEQKEKQNETTSTR